MSTADADAALTRLEARITAEIRERQANGWTTPGLREDLRDALRTWTSIYDRATAR